LGFQKKKKPGLPRTRQAGFGEFTRRSVCADTSSLAGWQMMVVVVHRNDVLHIHGAKVGLWFSWSKIVLGHKILTALAEPFFPPPNVIE